VIPVVAEAALEQDPVSPLQDAGTRAAATTGFSFEAGFSPVAIDVAPLPVFPVLTLGVAVERGLTDHVDLGVRYTTWLGFDHRLGPELQLAIERGGPWSVGVRAHPWIRFAGAAGRTLSYGGDLSTQAAAVVSRRFATTTWTFEAGATPQWVLFERIDGESFADTDPWLATIDGAVELAWADRWAEALSVRLEVGVSRAPADPIAVLGMRPRLVVGGHFGANRRASEKQTGPRSEPSP
jgi:hypothetical protein